MVVIVLGRLVSVVLLCEGPLTSFLTEGNTAAAADANGGGGGGDSGVDAADKDLLISGLKIVLFGEDIVLA
jgi:hypothetical protein